MSLINFAPIQDGDEASDDLFNTRFSAILDLLNGGLDADNLANNAVSTAKIADSSVTTNKIIDKAVTAAKIEAQQTWIFPTLQNGWVQYDNTWEPPGYYKDSLGRVHLRGLVRSGTAASTIFTLPAGYRPTTNSHISTCSSGGYAEINIFADGRVQHRGTHTGWFSLANISIRAEQ